MPALSFGGIRITALCGFVNDPGTGRMNVAPGWGMHASGGAYFNPNGPNVGEAAWMRMDAQGHLHLESAVSATGSLLEGVLRPVAQFDPAPAVVRRKDGPTPAAPQFRVVPISTGRPIQQPDLFALPVREKPGHAATAPTTRPPVIRSGRPVAQRRERPTQPGVVAAVSTQAALEQHKRRQERRQRNTQRIALNVGGAHG